jgi:excisionase family DNA binding protein
MQDGLFIGTAEAASLLGINRSTLTRWVEADKIAPALTVPGYKGALLFDAEAVNALAKEGTQ